ncbi:MAG: M48 family metallopeptidase [Pseudomonadota bacterium]
MTALSEYEKLEAMGRYFDGQSARPQDVIIGFGKRSLTIFSTTDVALAHWPLGSLRAVSGRGAEEMVLVPSGDAEERLILDDALMKGALSKVCPDLYRRATSGKSVRVAGLWGVSAVASVVAIVFFIIPALAVNLAPLIPPEREQALGDAVAKQITFMLGTSDEKNRGFCGESEGTAALQKMEDRVMGDLELPYPLRVDVLDHPLVNAVAMPGGRVILFRGLIDESETPEEVAGVLAHEIAHVVHRDPTVGVLRTAGTAGIFSLVLGDLFGAGVIAAAGEAMLNASYQREAELRADNTAIQMLADAGLPSDPFAGFFERLREKHGDTPLVMRYFASHPELEGRAERARAGDTLEGSDFVPVLTDRDWVALQGICSDF